jgi:hypothetical protein
LSEPFYEQRYCAFVDILGFRGLIGLISQGEMPPEHLRTILRHIHTPATSLSLADSTDLRALSISDAVVLSASLTEEGLQALHVVISDLAMRLLPYGYFIRGGLTAGRIYQDSTTAFGEGLVRAYDIESKIARYPRVVVTSDVASVFHKDYEQHRRAAYPDNFCQYVHQSDDGPFFLNIFKSTIDYLYKNCNKSDLNKIKDDSVHRSICTIAEKLQKRFSASADDPRVFEKMQWFSDYWNRAIPTGIPGLSEISGPAIFTKHRPYDKIEWSRTYQ